MFYSKEFELDLIAFCIKKPLYLRQHIARLKNLKFQDKYIQLIYKTIFNCLEDYQTIPTVTELQRIAMEKMAEKSKFTQLEIEAVTETIGDIYSRNVTDLTGVSISSYLIEEESKKIAQELSTFKADDVLENLNDLSHRLAKLKYFTIDDEDLGLNFFSPEGMASAKELLDTYNTTSCLSSGYTLLDHQLQGGFRKGELCVFIATTNLGKAQSLDTKIVTPNGYRKMGDLKIGDLVIDSTGNPTEVVGIFPQGIKKNYRITFTDGTYAESCDEHLWWVRNSSQPGIEFKVKALKEFMHSLVDSNGKRQWFMPLTEAVEFPKKDLPIDPYVLGAILGDGCISSNRTPKFTSADPELLNNLMDRLPEGVVLQQQASKKGYEHTFKKAGNDKNPYNKNPLTLLLKELNLLGLNSKTKFIPEEYLWGSFEQRLDLLRGLMDTDGTPGASPDSVDYCCKSIQLIEGVEHLVRSLGGVARRGKTRVVNGVSYPRTFLTIPVCPFLLSRKASKYSDRLKRTMHKTVDKVELVGEVEMQCIKVSSPTSSYLINDFIVTHNTSLLLNFAANFVKQKLRVVYLALDNLEGEMIARTVGCLLNQDITQGVDASSALDQIADAFGEEYNGCFWYKHFAPRELTKSKLERYLDKLKTYLYEKDKENGVPEEECGNIDVIIIDYMDLMVAESGAGEFWISAEHLAQEVKAVLKNRHILGLTATQGGTDAMKADTVKLFMAAGAKSRFNAPDLVFGMSQDDSEKMCKPAKFRLGCLKARRAKVSYQIPFEFYKEKQVIREADGAVILNMVSKAVSETGTRIAGRNDYYDNNYDNPLSKIEANMNKMTGNNFPEHNLDSYGET